MTGESIDELKKYSDELESLKNNFLDLQRQRLDILDKITNPDISQNEKKGHLITLKTEIEKVTQQLNTVYSQIIKPNYGQRTLKKATALITDELNQDTIHERTFKSHILNKLIPYHAKPTADYYFPQIEGYGIYNYEHLLRQYSEDLRQHLQNNDIFTTDFCHRLPPDVSHVFESAAIFWRPGLDNWVAFVKEDNNICIYIYDNETDGWIKQNDFNAYIGPSHDYNLTPEGLSTFNLLAPINQSSDHLIQAFEFAQDQKKNQNWFYQAYNLENNKVYDIASKIDLNESSEPATKVTLYTVINGEEEKVVFEIKKRIIYEKLEVILYVMINNRTYSKRLNKNIISRNDVQDDDNVDLLLACFFSEKKGGLRNIKVKIHKQDDNYSLAISTLKQNTKEVINELQNQFPKPAINNDNKQKRPRRLTKLVSRKKRQHTHSSKEPKAPKQLRDIALLISSQPIAGIPTPSTSIDNLDRSPGATREQNPKHSASTSSTDLDRSPGVIRGRNLKYSVSKPLYSEESDEEVSEDTLNAIEFLSSYNPNEASTEQSRKRAKSDSISSSTPENKEPQNTRHRALSADNEPTATPNSSAPHINTGWVSPSKQERTSNSFLSPRASTINLAGNRAIQPPPPPPRDPDSDSEESGYSSGFEFGQEDSSDEMDFNFADDRSGTEHPFVVTTNYILPELPPVETLGSDRPNQYLDPEEAYTFQSGYIPQESKLQAQHVDLSKLLETLKNSNQSLNDIIRITNLYTIQFDDKNTANTKTKIHKFGYEQFSNAKNAYNNIFNHTKNWTEYFKKIIEAQENGSIICNEIVDIKQEFNSLFENLTLFDTVINNNAHIQYYNAFPYKKDADQDPRYEDAPTKEKKHTSKALDDKNTQATFNETSTDVFIKRKNIKKIDKEYQSKKETLTSSTYLLIIDALKQHRFDKGTLQPLYLAGDTHIVAASVAAARRMNFQKIIYDEGKIKNSFINDHAAGITEAYNKRQLQVDENNFNNACDNLTNQKPVTLPELPNTAQVQNFLNSHQQSVGSGAANYHVHHGSCATEANAPPNPLTTSNRLVPTY